ncbi:PD-(D/E)XK nuclease family protein [Steroidobacter sp. S1-65]|uniref:PD-(D/E)XK nuclease family protein n=1 Tax=Steroidobacter gossypii TaxID=2805490 RepID=A0ABS1WX55_9GAMM|nr:PD-(D/E)XK nuclease family protein [Steroidobacter gossypii]MBM0105562.1 PD-(D/E)XK nuclease family protein [Steroidobacter gossypii]
MLTASRRLAHALRLGYAQHAQSRGQTVWRTPRILPWSTWLAQQWLEARAIGAHSHHARLLTNAQARVLWDALVNDSEWGEHLLNPSNAARLAARSWRRMQEYLIPLPALQNSDSSEGHALHAWCSDFLKRCEKLQAIDETRLPHWAHDANFVPEDTLALAGFDTIPPSIARLIERWRALGKVVDIEAEERTSRSVVVVTARDADDELELAARWARAQIATGKSTVGVVVAALQTRRAEVQRVFEDVFAPGQRNIHAEATRIPVVIAAPSPLASYPIVDAALLVLQFALHDRPATHAGRLLRTPFIAGGESEKDRRAMADFRLREEQRDRWDWFELERWASATGCDQLALAARRISEQLRGQTSATGASVWAERFHAWLRAIGWPGERSLSSVEHQTVLKFHAALSEFGTLDAVTPPLSASAALSRLQELLRETPFEPETQATSITVIDPATVAGMTFDATWVTGLDAARLPEPVNPDPLLPVALQRAAKIPEATAEGVMQLSRARLARWTSSAPEVVLSWPRQEGEAELQPSPMLATWPTIKGSDIAMAAVRPLRRTLFEHRPLLEQMRDELAPRLKVRSARGGAMTLELQSRCPFRAQAQIRLGAEDLPTVSLGVEPIDRGIILHRVLEEIWGGLRTHAALVALDEQTLAQRVRDSAERHTLQALQPTVRYRERLAALEASNIAKLVLLLLAVEKQRPPFSLRFTETSEPYAIGGLSITLQPDRIDALSNGGHLLIDYKLGDSHTPRQWLDTLPGRPRRPQLPLYGLAHAETLRGLAYVVLAAGTVEYRGWTDGTFVGEGVLQYPAGVRLRVDHPADWPSLVEHWRKTLTNLAESFVTGQAMVDPLPGECANCHLSAFCRIREQTQEEELEHHDE